MNLVNSLNSVPSGKLTAQSIAAFSGITAEILLGGAQAPMTVMAMTIAAGQGAPAHISKGEDKLFQVTAGRLIFLVGDERISVSAGEIVFVAGGVAHSFSPLGNESAKMTLVASPARHDQFFQAMSELPLPHSLENVSVHPKTS